MAIYHLSVKAVSRSAGRSSTAAAAYRSGCEITDQRTGEVHDYTRKGGVLSADVVLPRDAPQWAADRGELWNAAEAAERRKDACVAREIVVALPDELSAEERKRLAIDFAQDMADKEGCAVDVALHAPSKGGDDRNYHAHLLRTTRKIGENGLTDKLDTEKAGRNRTADLEAIRARWAELSNERLQENRIDARIDHRSLKDQGIEREPTVHFGPAVTEMHRRGVSSHVQHRIDVEIETRLRAAQEQAKRDQEAQKTRQSIIDLSTDIAAARIEKKLQSRMKTWEAKAEEKLAEREYVAEQERQRKDAETNAERARKAAEAKQYFDNLKRESAEKEHQLLQRKQLAKPQPQTKPRPRGNDYEPN